MSKKSSGKKPLLGNSPNSPAKKEEKNDEAPDKKNNNKDSKRDESRPGRGSNRNSRSVSKSRRNRSRSPLARKFNNRDVCRDFLRNRCTRNGCRYFHPPDKEPQTMSWFTLCLDYQKGNCPYEDCRLFHLSTEDEDLFIATGDVSLHIIEQAMCNAQLELPTERDQPTCKDYLKGRCRMNNCRHRHITPAEYERELYQCIQDALGSILGPPRGELGDFPNQQQMPLLGGKDSLLGPAPSNFGGTLQIDNASGSFLNQRNNNKAPLMPLPQSLLPIHDDSVNDVEGLRRVCHQLRNQLDVMHREREEQERRLDRKIVGNMLQNSRGGGGPNSEDQCLMSKLNAELQEEVEKLSRRNEDLVNKVYNVDWDGLSSEIKMRIDHLENENRGMNEQLNRLEKQNSILKKEAHLWKNYEMLVKDQLSKLQKQFFTAEREFCVSWGGGPPPLDAQKEAWSAIKSTVSYIARANIQNPSTLKPPPNVEPVSKMGPEKVENWDSKERRSSPAAASKPKPLLDPLKPPFQEGFFPGQNIGRPNSPRFRANSSNRHDNVKPNQDNMRKNVPNYRPSSPNNIRSDNMKNFSKNMRPDIPANSKQDEQTSFWKSSGSSGSFAVLSSGPVRQSNPNHAPGRPEPNNFSPDSQSNFRSKGFGGDRPSSSNPRTKPSSMTHVPRNSSSQNPHSKIQTEDSYGSSNYPSDNLVRYPMPAKENYNTGIPGTYMSESSQKNADLHADYQNNSSGHYSTQASTPALAPAPAPASDYYSSNTDSSGYYSSTAISGDNYGADSSGYYQNASQDNSASAPENYSTNAAGQVSSDAQGNYASPGNYQDYSASSEQYPSAHYGYDESYGSYYDNSSKNAEIISQMYSQPPPPPPSQNSPNKSYPTDSWKSGYYG